MKHILILVIIITFANCISQKRRSKICASCPIKTVIKDSIREIITVKPFDTTLFISTQIPNNTELTGNCNVLCDSLNKLIDKYLALGLDGIIKTENGIKTTISKNLKGNFIFKAQADSLKTKVALLQKEIKKEHFRNVENTKIIKVECLKQHRNWLDRVCRWVSLIFIIIILVYFSPKIIKLIKIL